MIDAAYVRECLDYDQTTGDFTWKLRPRHHFNCDRGWNSWNARFPGKPTAAPGHRGYRGIRIGRKHYKAHRIAWLLTYGDWPVEIDHINGQTGDNRLINLREVTHAENCRNRQLRSDNASGAVGVFWDPRKAKWIAYVDVDGRRFNLGHFVMRADAVLARANSSLAYSFHANHGRRALDPHLTRQTESRG